MFLHVLFVIFVASEFCVGSDDLSKILQFVEKIEKLLEPASGRGLQITNIADNTIIVQVGDTKKTRGSAVNATSKPTWQSFAPSPVSNWKQTENWKSTTFDSQKSGNVEEISVKKSDGSTSPRTTSQWKSAKKELEKSASWNTVYTAAASKSTDFDGLRALETSINQTHPDTNSPTEKDPGGSKEFRLEDHEVEVREYPPTTLVCTMLKNTTQADYGIITVLDKIEGYIHGQNSKGEVLPKTVPIFYGMSFPFEPLMKMEVCYWLAQESSQEMFPAPTDPRVYLKDNEKTIYYSRAFDIKDGNIQEVAESLKQDLEVSNLHFIEGAVFATASIQSDDNRRNEVMFRSLQ